MEKTIKPENLFIGRKRLLPALAALIFLAFGIFLALFIPLGLIGNVSENGQLIILISVCSGILSAISLLFGAFNLRNVFFPFILTADEKGIYNYSGILHFGLIKWKDILSITYETTFFDMLDGDGFSLSIYLKDFKEFKRGLSFLKKLILTFSGGKIRIHTACSQIKRKKLNLLLNDMNSYYNVPAQTVGAAQDGGNIS